LHVAVSKRPIFTGCVDEIDPDILLSYASLLVNLVGNQAEELLLNVDLIVR
jgi:hypothetical protein